jgi:vesicle coat complex subunit
VGDANPMVVANAVTALMDIHLTSQALQESGQYSYKLSSLLWLLTTGSIGAENSEEVTNVEWHVNSTILNKLLIALNECSEWGRVAILTQLGR